MKEDSLFEQIMRLKRSGFVQPKSKTSSKIIRKKPEKQLSELDFRYNKLVAESSNRNVSHERVLEIRKELTEIRRLKRHGKK